MFGKYLSDILHHATREIDLIARITQHPLRPKPLRDYDQIYMLPGSELGQAKLISDYLYEKEVVLVGDGDCMSLVLGILGKEKIIEPPSHMLVLDFDERILHFISEALREFKLDPDLIQVSRYNVRSPVPSEFEGRADVFYTNPPYGSADKGECGKIFLSRCMELCKPIGSSGIAILPYETHASWSREAMANIQKFAVDSGYVVSEMVRGIHQYNLDNRPDLYSGPVVLDRVLKIDPPYRGKTFSQVDLKYFYGKAQRQMPDYIDCNGAPVFADAKSA
jgi:N4-bis(aminopropyl)spermidine synthase